MNLRIVRTIFAKELLDTVRDKRTLVMMVVVPVLLYPALMLAGLQAALVQQTRMDVTQSRVAIEADSADTVAPWINTIPKVQLTPSKHPRNDLETGKLDAVVIAEPGARDLLAQGATVNIRVLFDSTEFRSAEAANRIADALEQVRLGLLKTRLADIGRSDAFINPIKIERSDTAPPAKTTGNLIGTALPVLMVIMLALGAFYPAVDVTAGEKERGTFETLLSTPVSKLEIVAGKYLAVCSLSLSAGLLNLASMLATFAVIFVQIAPRFEGKLVFKVDMHPGDVALILLVMLPLAACISAFTMCVAVFARSFREAQNYVTPLFLAVTFPAMYASFPGVHLDGMNRFIPVANWVLLFRDLVTGKGHLGDAMAVFLSTSVFAMLGVLLAVWIFQREEVVLAEERGIPITLRRSQFTPREYPTPGLALAFFGLIMLALFYVASPLQQWRLLPGLAITEWGLLLPLAVGLLWFMRIDLRASLALRAPAPAALAGALLAGIGWTGLVIQIGVWNNRALPLPGEFEEMYKVLFAGGATWRGLLPILFVVALSPAVCEEVAFRGFILGGLRSRLGFWSSAIITGVLFGAFHMSIHRFVPTALTGVLFSIVLLRTRSLLPSVMLHFILNGASILIATEHLKLPGDVDTHGLPAWLLVLCGLLFAGGTALLFKATSPRRRA